MKFTCSRQQLVKAVNTVSKAVSVRTTIPILKGILLKAEKNGVLTLSASDMDMSIQRMLDVSVEEEGSAVVLAKLFSDIVRSLPDETVFVEEKEENLILIRCGSSEFTVVGLPPDEFPGISDPEGTSGFRIDKNILKDMIKKTVFSASIDESKGIIVGALTELEKDSVNMVALDGFRMSVVREAMENKEEKKIVASARILSEIHKILTESEEEEILDVLLENKKAVVKMTNTKIILRLLDGEFIKYRDITPKEFKTEIILNKSDFLSALERASLLAKEGKNNLVRISLAEEILLITSRSEEGNVREEVPVTKTGENLEIGFNSKYLIDALKAIGDEEIRIGFNTSVTPCLIRPLEGNSFEYLILPVRLTAG